MNEMRVQAASLLCKVYLKYLVLLSEWDGMRDLWIKVIDTLNGLMNSGQGDSLVSQSTYIMSLSISRLTDAKDEAVRENLKNVLLFMASSGYLVPSSEDASMKALWHDTWQRIDLFLPDLKKDLALEEPKAMDQKGQSPADSAPDVKEDRDKTHLQPGPKVEE